MSESNSYYSSSSYDSSSDEDASEENVNYYKPGGYAPISIGEVLDDRYRVFKKIGFGHFSIVYLVYDYTTSDFVAMKVSKSDKLCTESTKDEISILNTIDHNCCNKLRRHFEYTSIFGDHIVLIFNIHGETLYRVLRENDYVGLPPLVVKSICLDLLNALEYLNDIGIINTDVKPENILIREPNKQIKGVIKDYEPPPITEGIKLEDRHPATMSNSQREMYDNIEVKKKPPLNSTEAESEMEYISRIQRVVLSDFGNACRTDNHYSSSICTRQYKPPENILTNEYDTTADIWGLGCIIYEMLTGNVLFQPELFDTGSKTELDDSHLASILEITGGDILAYEEGEHFKNFARQDGSLRFINNLRRTSLSSKIKMNSNLSVNESKEWANFILYILNFDYKRRPSAKDILHKYRDWLKLNL